jgi:hypothetical protein
MELHDRRNETQAQPVPGRPAARVAAAREQAASEATTTMTLTNAEFRERPACGCFRLKRVSAKDCIALSTESGYEGRGEHIVQRVALLCDGRKMIVCSSAAGCRSDRLVARCATTRGASHHPTTRSDQ